MRDIWDTMGKAQQFVEHLSYEQFAKDDKTVFAVIRALEIIGEATKNIPHAIRKKHPEVPWKDMAGCEYLVIFEFLSKTSSCDHPQKTCAFIPCV